MALESVGFLASHYCDTPALVGVGLDDDRFTAKVLSGTVLSEQSLKNALYVVGEDRSMRNMAMEFSEAMSGLGSDTLQPTTQDHAAAVVRGTYRGTWLEGYVGPSLLVTREVTNEPLQRFAGAFASQGPAMAHAYLKGVAAVCSLAAQAVVVPEQGNLLPFFRERTQTGEAGSRPRRRLAGSSCPTRTLTPSRSRRCSTRPPSASRRSQPSRPPAATARATSASPPPSASSPTTLTASRSTRWSRPRSTIALRA